MKKQKNGKQSNKNNKLHKERGKIHLYLIFVGILATTLIISNSNVQNLIEYEVYNLQQTILVKIHSPKSSEVAKAIGLDKNPYQGEIYSGIPGDFDTPNFLVKTC